MGAVYDNGYVRLYQADARSLPLEDESVDCCVTSPPYWGLRDYGVPGQLGLEATPEEYVYHMVQVFREVWRVLKPTGTLWLNLGDSYAGAGGAHTYDHAQSDIGHRNGLGGYVADKGRGRHKKADGLKPKDLVGIPWMVAFALRADGWWLRSDIIWAKRNPMPESVTDRPTRAHEYIFLLAKSQRYYYDHEAIKEPAKDPLDDLRRITHQHTANKTIPTVERNGLRPRATDKQSGHGRRHAGFNDRWDSMTKTEQAAMGRNKRSVWNVATQPYHEAHFATFPEALVEPCILAGCPEGGTVLDPFIGSGTTAAVAQRLGRRAVGVDLNPAYLELAAKRVSAVRLPLSLATPAAVAQEGR